MTLREADPEPVLVIGAGLAGLTAAHSLAREGVASIVLEAGGRPGGRIYTRTEGFDAGQCGELGAETVQAGSTAVTALCADLRVELSEPIPCSATPMTALEGLLTNDIIVIGGCVLTPSRVESICREASTALRGVPPSPQETVAQWLRRAALSDDARAVLEAASRALAQRDSTQTDGCVLTDDAARAPRRIIGGTQRLIEALVENIDLRLDATVTVIRQRRGRITVVLDDGQTVSSTQAVVAVSPLVLGAIGFDPPLPASTLFAATSTPRSHGSKVVAQYREGSAVRAALAHGVCSDGAISRAWVSSGDITGPVMVSALVCGTARAQVEAGDGALDALDALLEVVVGHGLTRIGGVIKNWSADERFLGMGGVPPMSLRGSHIALLAAAERRVHFAGAHTDDLFCGTLEGAVRSGQRAALEVVRHPERVSADYCNTKLVRA